MVSQTRHEVNNQGYWQNFVDRFFSPSGVLRTQLWSASDQSAKSYEIPTPILAKYYWTHFNSGISNIQMTFIKSSEKDLPNIGHFVECSKCTFYNTMTDGHVVKSSDPITSTRCL